MERINVVNTYTPDALIAGDKVAPLTTVGTIVASAGALARGTVLGKITIGAITAAAKAGGNAANTGALTLDATAPILAGAKVGVYTVRCIAAASNGGTFRVMDPDGFSLGDYAVGATFANDVKFAIADGTQDFIVGEGFDITIAAGSGQYKIVNSANVDGSAVPVAVLAQAVTVTTALPSLLYVRGMFNENHLVFGGSDTADTHRAAMQKAGMILTLEQ